MSESHDSIQIAEAAIRSGAGFLAQKMYGLIEVEGADRQDFLHRILTNEVAALEPGQGQRAFLLTRDGRVQADLLVLHGESMTHLAVIGGDADQLIKSLDAFVFSEDVTFRNADQYRQIGIHGPQSADLLDSLTDGVSCNLQLLCHQVLTLGDGQCMVFRHDWTVSPGLTLLTPGENFDDVMELLSQQAQKEAIDGPAAPIDESVFDAARIVAGRPMFGVDFSDENRPHETGLVDQTVSFTKGCYVGQEIVARTQHLGHPSKILVGLDINSDHVPDPGAALTTSNDQKEIGQITSAALSPMKRDQSVALAMINWDHRQPGALLKLKTADQNIDATVRA